MLSSAPDCASCDTPTVNDRAAADLEALSERDERLAAESLSLRNVEREVAAIRSRVEAISSQLEAFPADLERLKAAAVEAAAELERRKAASEVAATEVEGEHDNETQERLERAATRARERADDAAHKFERATATVEQLEGDTAESPAELAALRLEALALAEATPVLGTPEPGTDGLIAWASRAQAELFVEVGQLDRQRDNVIREANELATMLLGEPTYGSTVAQAVERVEQSRR
jgi:chromosome segregation ATPase